VFRPLRKYWNEAVHAFVSKHPGKIVATYNFSPILQEAWSKAMTQENICSGFRNCDFYPFNQTKMQPTIMNEN